MHPVGRGLARPELGPRAGGGGGQPLRVKSGRRSYGVELVGAMSLGAAWVAPGRQPGHVSTAESGRVGRSTPRVPLHQSGDANEGGSKRSYGSDPTV